MRLRQWTVLLSAIALGASGSDILAQSTMDFDGVTAGTVFGGMAVPPDTPGDVVLTQEGIDMSVELYMLGGFSDFFAAEVGVNQVPELPTQSLALDNISVAFDFADVGFEVGLVTLDFRDLGGTSNFVVNGSTLHIIDPLSDLPPNVAPGVTAEVAGTTVRLTADEGTNITGVGIGGQELFIDNIVAFVPEPTTLALIALGMGALLRRRPGGLN